MFSSLAGLVGAKQVGGGLMEDVFGGDPKVKHFSTMSGSQRAINDRVTSYLYPRVYDAQQNYQGRQTAPMSSLEQQGYGMAQQYAQSPGQYMPERMAAYGKAVTGQMIPQSSFGRLQQNYQSNVAPRYAALYNKYAGQATENARGMGALTSSSAMARANAGAAQEYAFNQAQQEQALYERQMQEQNQIAAQNAAHQQAAMNSQDPYQQQQAMGMQAAYQYGALPRQLQQMAFDAQDEYTRNVLNQAMAFLGMQQQGTYSVANPGAFGQTMGAMSQVGNMLGTFTGAIGNLTAGQKGGSNA